MRDVKLAEERTVMFIKRELSQRVVRKCRKLLILNDFKILFICTTIIPLYRSQEFNKEPLSYIIIKYSSVQRTRRSFLSTCLINIPAHRESYY
jgi:hypothetical protein